MIEDRDGTGDITRGAGALHPGHRDRRHIDGLQGRRRRRGAHGDQQGRRRGGPGVIGDGQLGGVITGGLISLGNVGQDRGGAVAEVPEVAGDEPIRVAGIIADEADRERRGAGNRAVGRDRGTGARGGSHRGLIHDNGCRPVAGKAETPEGGVVGVTGQGVVGAALAVDHDVIGSSRDGHREIRAEPGGGALRQHEAVGVDQGKRQVEIGRGLGHEPGDVHRTGAGGDPEPVLVGAIGDDAAGGEIGAGHHGGGGRGGSMLVGDAGDAPGDQGDLVLGVVGERIIAASPLDNVLVVADPHDRGPVGMPAVVLDAGGLSGVVEAEGVADLMRGGLGDVAAAIAQLLREYKGGDIVDGGGRGDDATERAHVGDPARGGAEPLGTGTADDATHPMGGVRGGGAAELLHARVFRRDVHIPGGVVLRDATPDVLDDRTLGVGERRRVAIGVESRGHDRGARGIRVIPRGAGRRVAVEVQVDHLGRARARVEQEGVGQRLVRGRGVGRGIRTDLRLGAETDEVGAVGAIEVKVLVVTAGSVKANPLDSRLISRAVTFGARRPVGSAPGSVRAVIVRGDVRVRRGRGTGRGGLGVQKRKGQTGGDENRKQAGGHEV